MPAVRTRHDPQQLYFQSNATLASLTGLENLTTVGSIVVFEQPALTNLAALAALKTIAGPATFQDNPLLSQCEIQQLVTRCGATMVDLQDNGPCN